MDHLLRPFGIELTEDDEIPYVSSNDYHGVPFLDYVNTNKAYQLAPDIIDAASMSKYESKMETSELERFLQTWLFFGLLQETLGAIFHQPDFVLTTRSKVIITTKILIEKLNQAMCDSKFDQKRLTHLHQCLHMTMLALIATPGTFDIRVKIGIAATAEVIDTALILAAKAKAISTEMLPAIGRWGYFDEQKLRVAEMQERHGWCPAQASLTLEKFCSLQAKVYISKIRKPYNGVPHDACSFGNCRALQIDPSSYQSLHRHPGICEDVESNQEEVVKALKMGKNALLDLKLDLMSNKVSVAIVAAQPNFWYIALSHVWADGLGNAKENSLPQCQLRHIYDLLTSFCTEESIKDGQKRPYLWLDTLCCPVDPENKLLALAKLPEAYREASQILVSDSSLTEIDCKHFQPIEILSRVFSSGWIFRLWTLNEANLAFKLWIQFRDEPLELGQVLSNLAIMENPETYHFTGELYSEYGKLRIGSSKGAGGELWFLTEALRCRSVSEVSDEPICVGALLRLDVNGITGKEKLLPGANQEDRIKLRNQRMARLWKSAAQGQTVIPKASIYHVGNRLTEPGLRWAPSTLLNITNTSPFFYAAETDCAHPSADGLIFSNAACSVSVPERVDGILGPPWTAASSMLDVMKCGEDHWLTIFSTSEQKKYPSGRDDKALYDIMIEARTGTEFEILVESTTNLFTESHKNTNGLLVAATAVDKSISLGAKNVRFLRQGWIMNHDRTTCDFLNLLLTHAQALQSHSITKEMREMGIHGDKDQRYLDAFKTLLGKAWLVVDQLEAELDATGKHLPGSGLGLMHARRKSIFALLSRFYRNRYLVQDRVFDIAQEFCLD